MHWNWQLPKWPNFNYNFEEVFNLDKQFLLEAGKALASLKNIDTQEQNRFIVEILSEEGIESAKIEGEILDRKSLQSSIQKHFGLKSNKGIKEKEVGMAELLCDVYDSFDKPLTHQMLFSWHTMLFKEDETIADCGKYRTHEEPMQIVSTRYEQRTRVFFEAPPSKKVLKEMTQFIKWFNAANTQGSILGIAAVAHLYFESIHPFEDGNGRIGRALVEKILSQSIGRPILIAVSKILEANKKKYYSSLEECNKTLDIQEWIHYFANVILQAQKESLSLLFYLIEKSKFLSKFSGQINSRQEKALLRMFAEIKGFKGGLSAENYIAITKASRATATRDLNDLVEKEALKKTGELRHTRYYLNL